MATRDADCACATQLIPPSTEAAIHFCTLTPVNTKLNEENNVS
jgi:hypothetical protein